VLFRSLFAFGLGGLSLMGLPPSGGFTAKWLLLQATVDSGQWLWAAIVVGGGLLAGGYVYRVLAPALAGSDLVVKAHPALRREVVVLMLAIAALLLGFAPPRFLDLLQVGRQVILS
jgi:formate hydrogenlyase subunit 3/multisubunit Na+/H+ antiporter MnhD subunit